MPCSCKETHSNPAESQSSGAQQQYAVDLVNRHSADRTDAAACKVGKPCNGRCIPKNHRCGGGLNSSQHSEHDPAHDPANAGANYHKKTRQAISIRNGLATAGLIGAGVAGTALAANALSGGRIGNAVKQGGKAVEETIEGTKRSVQQGVKEAGKSVFNKTQSYVRGLRERTEKAENKKG